MSDRIYTQEELTALVCPVLEKYGAERAILFGSYARREADAESDIDLLVIGGRQFDPTDVFCVADELHRLTGKPVDVYELCEIEPNTEFYRTIFENGVKCTFVPTG